MKDGIRYAALYAAAYVPIVALPSLLGQDEKQLVYYIGFICFAICLSTWFARWCERKS